MEWFLIEQICEILVITLLKKKIFVIVYGSLDHTDNYNKNFLGEGRTGNIIDSVSTAAKNFSINFSKKMQHFPWVCITVAIIVIFLLTEKKSIKLKPIIIFQLFQNSIEGYLKKLNLVKYLLKEMRTTFQLLTMLLINLNY